MQPNQDSDPDAKWKLQCAEWRFSEGFPSSLKVWSPEMQATRLNVTPRVAEILDLVAATKLRELGVNLASPIPFLSKKKLLKEVSCDASQNPKFRSFTNTQQMTGCLATSTVLYSFGSDRLVTGFELALMQGNRRGLKYPRQMRNSEIRNLSGEGMALPCLATIVWAAFLVKGLP